MHDPAVRTTVGEIVRDSPAPQTSVLETLCGECSRIFGYPAEQIAPDTTFLALGADSLVLLRLSHAIQSRFGVRIAFRRLMTDLANLSDVANFIEAQAPVISAPQTADPQDSTSLASTSRDASAPGAGPFESKPEHARQGSPLPVDMTRILTQQLNVITMQLQLLGRTSAMAVGPVTEPRDVITGRSTAVSQDTAMSGRLPISEWMWIPSWKRSVRLRRQEISSQPILAFVHDGGPGEGLIRLLRAQGTPLLVVKAGTHYARLSSGEWRINPQTREHYTRLLEECSGRVPQRILHLWNLRPDADTRPAPAVCYEGYRSLIFLAHMLDRAITPTALFVVSIGMHDVLNSGTAIPARSLLAGPCAAISRELPHVQCRSVDFDADEGEEASQLRAQSMLEELDAADAPETVAYARGQRWLPCYEQICLPAGVPRIRQQGVYWITGGTGGVGMCLAKHLARNFGARLVLSGRTARADDARLDSLKALGTEILVLPADVTSTDDMADVVSRAKRTFGRIDGVIHAAGVSHGGLLASQSGDDFAVLQAKVAGVHVLDDLLRGESPDFVLLCSSLAGLTGSTGRSEYISANRFLDAWATQASIQERHNAISIDWDTWRGIGMGMPPLNVAPYLKKMYDQAVPFGMRPEEGLAIFDAALRCGLPHIIVSTRNLPEVLRISAHKAVGNLDFSSSTDPKALEQAVAAVQELSPAQVKEAIEHELRMASAG